VLRSVIMTVVILQSVFIYNDFQSSLYFLPRTQKAPAQLTLVNFKSQFTTQYNLLFANILLVTIPALIIFIFFNRKIVEGMARVPSKAERVTEEDFRRYGCCSGDRSAISDGSVDDWLVHGSAALADVRKRNPKTGDTMPACC
jgi:hypothetical protein